VAANGGTPAELFNLANHLSCRSRVLAFTMQIAAHVVDDHRRAMPCKRQRVRTAKTSSCSRDDGYPTVKISTTHSDRAPDPLFC
jgi:hypothetical protein